MLDPCIVLPGFHDQSALLTRLLQGLLRAFIRSHRVGMVGTSASVVSILIFSMDQQHSRLPQIFKQFFAAAVYLCIRIFGAKPTF